MSFDVFAWPAGDDPGAVDAVLQVLAPLLAAPPSDGYALVRTADGTADVYGLGTRGLMFTHASGRRIWQVIVDVARAAGCVVVPVGCPACVTSAEHLTDLPDELRRDAVVVHTGDDLLATITRA